MFSPSSSGPNAPLRALHWRKDATMKAGPCVLLVLLLVCVGNFLIGKAHGQSTERATSVPPRLTCSPAPCVLPPTQASEGGGTVTDTPIVPIP